MTDSLTVRDNRTGAEYEIPIVDGTIKAADLGQIKLNDDEPGLATYDPRIRQHRLVSKLHHLHRR